MNDRIDMYTGIDALGHDALHLTTCA
jgi:hypothetical protein